ncbi:dTDP-4-dehydrorhamnose reductase [Desulfothermobacter acidiphilus]|uniref:dTDP-4-dehydrorhamnose reductase n=1 Tax=Desulfothermobacter acidiphilus TaxID=1938353 RepID=UPI003F88C4A0
MRALITGAAGRLGRAMAKELEGRGWDVIGLARQQLDITSYKALSEALKEYRPRVVINCAAYTDVDGAESDFRRALLVNGLAPKYLASLCVSSGTKLVHVSTDYVFDGEKGEPYQVYDDPRPVNRYGESKLWGEEAIRESGADYLIIRTSWLFGTGRNFVSMILRLAETEGEIKVVEDQYGSPTYTPDAARAIADLILSEARGTFHVTNGGVASWYDLASRAVRLAGIEANIIPCSSQDFPRPAPRPRYTVLDPFPLKEYIGYKLVSWEDALERYLARG